MPISRNTSRFEEFRAGLAAGRFRVVVDPKLGAPLRVAAPAADGAWSRP
jgi:hypothetical protein